MRLSLIILAISSLVELMIWLPGVWRLRIYLSVLVIVGLIAGSSRLLADALNPWTLLIAGFSFYRIFNLVRLNKAGRPVVHVHGVTLKTSLTIVGWQLLAAAAWRGGQALNLHTSWYFVSLALAQLLFVLVLFLSTWRHLETTHESIISQAYADRDLPTLTVAIPARNETDELQACLESLLTNTYPKLEVIVLDDCSQNAKTPEVIRAYAHAGVRFIAGNRPPGNWLAKNWAYQRLASEANGELILFCGADIIFKPDSLRRLVDSLLEKHKNMISFMPQNPNLGFVSLIQPMRYAWEIALPRRLFKRPPVLSTCWLIRRSLLETAGGFKAVSRAIVPESYFAKVAAKDDGYSFLRTRSVSSLKSIADQRATAIRLRYPQLHRRPEIVALVTLSELLGLIGSFMLLVISLTQGLWLIVLLSGLSSLLLVTTYALVSYMTYQKLKPESLLVLPLAVIVDLGLMHYSMYKYEFSEVIWKDRNVCIPVMQVIPNLPKL